MDSKPWFVIGKGIWGRGSYLDEALTQARIENRKPLEEYKVFWTDDPKASVDPVDGRIVSSKEVYFAMSVHNNFPMGEAHKWLNYAMENYKI